MRQNGEKLYLTAADKIQAQQPAVPSVFAHYKRSQTASSAPKKINNTMDTRLAT
ncbi:hypothetical protein [Halovibrio sp. HP20-50]|uniref:hypothetical protein n=1 Tax=Halovibrio sp. HP20-59 TaxID=3080275 RepID=UPI00294ACA47|nr:hypothetical protein [Halovibrio sp. HP20-59]MEA2117864.1 hypothetical protein [Halovibrio sp. HP20-59]